jgi:FkbM family methyltransferase
MRIPDSLQRSLGRARELLGRSQAVTKAAVVLRKQLDGIILSHLGHDTDPDRNGEHWLLEQIAGDATSFVDVGANVGSWTAAIRRIAAPGAHGLLLEPSSIAARCLRERFAGDDQIEILEVAGSNEDGSTTFFEEPHAGTTSSLHGEFSSKTARAVTVPTRRLDTLLRKRRIDTVDVLKIDAEGHDFRVLQGATDALADQRIRFLQFEYNAPWSIAGCRLADARKLLDGSGYEMALLKGRGLYRFPYETYGEFYHYANFVAFPRTRRDELAHLVRGEI